MPDIIHHQLLLPLDFQRQRATLFSDKTRKFSNYTNVQH